MATKAAAKDKARFVVTRYGGDNEAAKSVREQIERQLATDGFVTVVLRPTIYNPKSKRYDGITGRALRIRIFDAAAVTELLDSIEEAVGLDIK